MLSNHNTILVNELYKDYKGTKMRSDIMKNGIYITGGGALILGIDEMIEQRTGIRTYIADDPLNCVAKGTGMALKDINLLQNNGYIFKTREQVKGYSEDSST